jgi:Tfp pilus assembly protein PilF
MRAGQQPDADRIAARLQSEHPQDWATRVVVALGTLDPAKEETARELEQLARENPVVPEELDLALALVELQRHNLDGGGTLLDAVLESFPVSVEARVLRAGVRHERGDLAGRDADLRRALELAAPDDERRSRWQAMLQRN